MQKETFIQILQQLIFHENPSVELGEQTFSFAECSQKYQDLEKVSEEEFKQQLFSILQKKSADYSGDDPFENFRQCEKIGVATDLGMKIRMLDKVSRIKNLTQKGTHEVEESLADTWLDLAGYIILYQTYQQYEKQK